MQLSRQRFAFILGIGMTTASQVASADVLFRPWKNRRESVKALTLSPDFQYATTTANYIYDGSTTLPSNLDRYSRIDAGLNATYGVSEWLSVYGRFQYTRAQVLSTGSANIDSAGLGDQTIGANARAWESRVPGETVPGSLDFQAQVALPAYDNSSATSAGAPFHGNGTTDWTLGAFLTIPVHQTVKNAWTVASGAGFTSRSDGYSSGVPWTLDLRNQQHFKGMIGSAGLQGYQSLGTDPYEGRSIASIRPAGSGGSFATGSVNPALIGFAGSIGYQFDPRVAVSASAYKSIYGKSAPELFAIGAALVMRWDWGTRQHPLAQTPTEYGKGNKGFVDYDSFSAKVTKTNERMTLIKIDKGSIDGVAVGQVFDVFVTKTSGEPGEVIARAQVNSVKSNEASLIILEQFREVWIEEGFVVRRPL